MRFSTSIRNISRWDYIILVSAHQTPNKLDPGLRGQPQAPVNSRPFPCLRNISVSLENGQVYSILGLSITHSHSNTQTQRPLFCFVLWVFILLNFLFSFFALSIKNQNRKKNIQQILHSVGRPTTPILPHYSLKK